MKYGKIPTWTECADRRDRNQDLAIEPIPLDPVEVFILQNEPVDGPMSARFRNSLQALVDFLTDD